MEKSFFAEAVFLLKTFFFVYIGLSVQLGDRPLLLQSLGLVLCLLLLRIPVVRLSLPHQLPRKDAVDASLMVAKGLAAAALASLPLSEGAFLRSAFKGGGFRRHLVQHGGHGRVPLPGGKDPFWDALREMF